MRKFLVLPLMVMMASPAFAAEMTPVRSITVNGMAKRQVVPDEAHLTVNLNSMEPKVAEAKAAHDEKLKKLMTIVKNAGIDEKKMRTQSSNMQPVYHYDSTNGKSIRTLDGYRVQTNIDITVSDTTKLAGLMDEVSNAGFEKGANQDWGNLTSVYYSLSDPDKIRDEMLVEALENAKDKASKLAVAAGSSIARVYQIQESGTPSFNFPRPMMMRAAAPMGMDAMAKVSVAPPAGEQEVDANVTVMYELKD